MGMSHTLIVSDGTPNGSTWIAEVDYEAKNNAKNKKKRILVILIRIMNMNMNMKRKRKRNNKIWTPKTMMTMTKMTR